MIHSVVVRYIFKPSVNMLDILLLTHSDPAQIYANVNVFEQMSELIESLGQSSGPQCASPSLCY